MTAPITNGKDFNYFRRLTISSAVFPTNANAEFTFRGNGSFSIINEGTGTIEYSFNGNTLHGDMVPSTSSAAMSFNQRGINKIWFRLASGASSNVRIEASAEGSIFNGSSSSGSSGGSTTGLALDTTLSAMSAKLPTVLGQTTTANSMSVTIASNQGAISTDTELPTAAALADATANPTITSVGTFNSVFNGTTWDRLRSGVSTVVSTATGWMNVLSGGKYNATAPILSDTQFSILQLDSSGNLKVVETNSPVAEDNANGVIWAGTRALATSTNTWSRLSSASGGVGTSGVSVKGSAGRVRYISVTNANATTGFYFGIYNKATAPVNTDVPVERKYIPPQTTSSTTSPTQVFDFGADGFYFSTGIGLAASTAIGALTLLGATDAHYTIYYI